MSSSCFYFGLTPVFAAVTQLWTHRVWKEIKKILKRHEHAIFKHYIDRSVNNLKHNGQLSVLNKSQLACSKQMTQVKKINK